MVCIEPDSVDWFFDVYLNNDGAAEGGLGRVECEFHSIAGGCDGIRQAQRGRLIGTHKAAGKKGQSGGEGTQTAETEHGHKRYRVTKSAADVAGPAAANPISRARTILGMKRFRALLALWSWAAMCAAGPTVTKVEPPNWWADHTINPIRLLIRGSELRGASVEGAARFTASDVRVNEAGTYLLCDLNIPAGIKPGSYPITIRTPDGATTAPFRIEAPLPAQGRFQGFSPDDVIYLIMLDRFANGNMSNDDPAVSRGLFGRSNSHFYHGGDFQGIIDHLPYLKSLGITAIWITPVYDNTNEPNALQKTNGKAIADYHGYGTVDYYGVEEHFGTMASLRNLVDAAHATGIKVIKDQAANHVGPYHPWAKDAPKATWFHGTAADHLNETWQIWSLPDPHASSDMKRRVLDGWFANVLPDMNQEDPDVARYEIQNALWWIGMAGFDGIRQDTLPYVPKNFWRDWSLALKRQYPDLRAAGEVFDPDPVVPSFFQG